MARECATAVRGSLAGVWRARRWRAVLRCGIAAGLLAVPSACRPPQEPIRVLEGTLIIENRSPREWRNVVVTVNDHYRGGAASVGPRGRLTAPLNQLTAGFGQRFDRSRQAVKKVEVTATDSEGEPVSLRWERPK